MRSSNIALAFEKCKQEHRPALLTYTVSGDPNKKKSFEILKAISSHADICEIGLGHNCNTGDGKQIQDSTYRAIKNGIKINDNSVIYLDHAPGRLSDISMKTWAGYIKYADHFLGCDSCGQHLAQSVNQKATVVTGGTFPINVSYPDDDNFTIFDLGTERRVYIPSRITTFHDKKSFETNKGIMKMNVETIDKIIDNVIGKT